MALLQQPNEKENWIGLDWFHRAPRLGKIYGLVFVSCFSQGHHRAAWGRTLVVGNPEVRARWLARDARTAFRVRISKGNADSG